MYFIRNIYTFTNGTKTFNLEEELKTIPNISMINYKYYIVNKKLLLVNLTNTHIVLVYINIDTGKIITSTNYRIAVDDICLLRSTISITLEDIILTIFTRLGVKPVIISMSLCCLSLVRLNKLSKQSDIASAECIALSGGILRGDILFKGDNYRKVLVDKSEGKWSLEFLKLYEKVYLFSVNSTNMLIKCIIYFNFKNDEINFGIRIRDVDYYYKCNSFNFVQLLLKLYNNKTVVIGEGYQLISSYSILYSAIEVAI